MAIYLLHTFLLPVPRDCRSGCRPTAAVLLMAQLVSVAHTLHLIAIGLVDDKGPDTSRCLPNDEVK